MTEDRKRLVEDNIGLAHFIAKRYKNMPLEYDDILSAAYLGLIKAADRFDFENGSRFSTYAGIAISNEILCHARRQRRHSVVVTSLDAEISVGDGSVMLGETIPDISDHFAEVERMLDMKKNSRHLTEREKQILLVKINYPDMTQKEVAEIFECKQSVISRHMKSIRKKMLV